MPLGERTPPGGAPELCCRVSVMLAHHISPVGRVQVPAACCNHTDRPSKLSTNSNAFHSMKPSGLRSDRMAPDGAPSDGEPSSALHKSRSAERVLALLDTVITSGAATLTDAAAEAGIPTSTALRHLRLLTNRGYLVRDDRGRYSVGPAFVRIALASFQWGPYARLMAAAQPGLQRLAEVTGESAYLAVRDGQEAVYIATVESRRAIRHVGWVGKSVPLEGTAVGEALLSEASALGVRPKAVINTGAIEPDVTAVVAPIHESSGVIGALSVLGPAERIVGRRLEVARAAVVDVAVSTSTSFGRV